MIGTTEILAISGALLTLLLSGNLYFIRKLFDRVDQTVDAQDSQAVEVSKISEGLNALSVQLRDIKMDMKDMRRIEVDVAILRAQCPNFNPARGFCSPASNEKEKRML